MTTPVEDLDTEQRTSIRAHYITGHFDLEEALIRIQSGGWTQLTRDQALDVLALPTTTHDVEVWTGRVFAEDQIAARLAEVKG